MVKDRNKGLRIRISGRYRNEGVRYRNKGSDILE
jgi:hypothetical protein